VVGTGGAVALLLAARRQRSAEIALKQKDLDQLAVARTHTLQERIAEDARLDAAERRLTELYTKAVDQLGSERLPVQLGGLYALERLGHSKDVGLHLVIARRTEGAGEAVSGTVFRALADIGTPGVVGDGDFREGPLLGDVWPSVLMPGRVVAVSRKAGHELVQLAWSEPDALADGAPQTST
jgi:hypothetical protein